MLHEANHCPWNVFSAKDLIPDENVKGPKFFEDNKEYIKSLLFEKEVDDKNKKDGDNDNKIWRTYLIELIE